MPTLTLKDHRLPMDDVAPWDTTVMMINKGCKIAEMVKDMADWANKNAGKGYRYLMIYCHGSSGFLQICDEGIQLKNVKKLESLAPYFDAVSIHACEVAKGNAGKAFCTKLAQVLVAPVTAAVDLQMNTGPETPYGFIDDRKYDGDYYTHDTAGGRNGPYRSRDRSDRQGYVQQTR